MTGLVSRIINKTRPLLLFLTLSSLIAACGGPQQNVQVAQNATTVPTAPPPPTAVPPTAIPPTPEPTPVPSPCTLATGGSHLVPFADGRWFLSGANVPWLNGGFGADFGTVEAWGQHTYDSGKADAMFTRLKESGANSVRWWVFADGRGAPEFDSPSGGKVRGLDERFLKTMADAVTQAAEHGIYIQFTLWSFDMLYADSTAQDRGEHAGGHRNIIVDEATRQSFINNAVIPMLKHPVPGTEFTIGTHPNVLGWGIINEPEWTITEAGSVRPEITEPVSLAEMQRFVAEVAGAIHRNSNQLVTLGSASMKWNSTQAKGAVGNWWGDAALKPFDPQGYLDFYSVHYYSWMEGDGQTWSYSPLVNSWQDAGFDKPVVIGELPANDGATGNGRSLRDLLEGIYTNCYAGAWVWSYEGVDGNGNWDTARTAFTAFNRQWWGETRVRPGVTR